MWDIAFVEIFSQREGFDIVIENPPYIRQEDISDLRLPRDERIKTANKKLYKAKLARSVYQAHPKFFGYQLKKDIKPDKPEAAVKNKLDAKSDLYIYFYFHGLSLLNPKGTFCTITSNSWLDVGYGKNLQEFLLKQCCLKMVLDNSAKRSFATADVNTVICLISAPNANQESCLQHTARFVNFTVPFEAILDAVIFYEIETAKGRAPTPEHRIYQLSQQMLLKDGMGGKEYSGNKWGGKYLRAPDIYWHLLEKGKGKLVRIRDVAEVRRGFTTGANTFFLLDQGTVSAWQIEDEFLRPVINSPKDVGNLKVRPESFLYKLFMCLKEKSELNGTAALNYIKWGEKQNFHRRPTCRSRRRWYDVGTRPLVHLNFPRVIGSTVRTIYAPNGCYAMDNFAEIHLPVNLRLPVCISLNSTLFQLMVNVNGRSNLGGGALAVQIYELENLLCVNPELILNGDQINQGILESEEWDVLKPSPARRSIDNIIFDILGLTQGERDGVYEAVIQLVTTRLEKARSV